MSVSTRLCFVIASFTLLCIPAPARGQVADPDEIVQSVRAAGPLGLEAEALRSSPLTVATESPTTPQPGLLTAQRQGSRQHLLGSLYVCFGGLQALDAHSTFRALDAGNVEGNPLMRWSTSHPLALISMKAAGSVGTIYVAQKIRKHHPKRAIAFIAAVNAGYALVVLHNYRAPAR